MLLESCRSVSWCGLQLFGLGIFMSLVLPTLPLAPKHAFENRVGSDGLRAAEQITKLQINMGLVCNLACKHCHVESSPKRNGEHENMQPETADRLIGWIEANPTIQTIDLTGGSPEMNPNFRRLVAECRRLGRHVMDRCNPTIIPFQPGNGLEDFAWLPSFLAEHQVEVVASLPCYLEDNVRQQRGIGAYDASVEGLRQLNAVGYGSDPGLRLNLVFNPTGAVLPPGQASLSEAYHRELKVRFDLVFNELWTITNMPIKRWRDGLQRAGKLEEYMCLLATAFNPSTIDGLMCRHQIHVDSQGRMFDCDFNYALGLPANASEAPYLWNVQLDALARRRIATGDHCYGCTAGAGSSCGGSLVS